MIDTKITKSEQIKRFIALAILLVLSEVGTIEITTKSCAAITRNNKVKHGLQYLRQNIPQRSSYVRREPQGYTTC